MPLRPAPDGMVNDTGNVHDSDETTRWGLEHNARLDAACPKASTGNPD